VQLPERFVVVERCGWTGLPDRFERGVKTSELPEQPNVGLLSRRWLDVIDELLELGPTASDPQEIASGALNRERGADLRPGEPLPQAPQSGYPATTGPRPVNPEHKRRLRVYPHVEVQRTTEIRPAGP
jgi:hypothetical protein